MNTSAFSCFQRVTASGGTDAPSSSSIFMEEDHSSPVMGDLGSVCASEMEIAHEGFSVGQAVTTTVEESYGALAEAFAGPRDPSEPSSDIMVEAGAKVLEFQFGTSTEAGRQDYIEMVAVPEEEAVDYGDSEDEIPWES